METLIQYMQSGNRIVRLEVRTLNSALGKQTLWGPFSSIRKPDGAAEQRTEGRTMRMWASDATCVEKNGSYHLKNVLTMP